MLINKELLIRSLKKRNLGNFLFFKIKDILGKQPEPDYDFPLLINIETSSVCNLKCIHCPPQLNEFKSERRKHNFIDLSIFNKIMDEIDRHGKRSISLHKDGEPLIHPQISSILNRVKKNKDHKVYITTNGHYLTEENIKLILENRIDIINLSIGAATKEFYEMVRGKRFERVISNIHNFLEAIEESEWKPRVLVQIINLKEINEIDSQIESFKEYWQNYDVELAVWDKLNWGVFDNDSHFKFRYPCYSLWESFNINSNNNVTACCMDWKQELLFGNISEQSIEDIWKGKEIDTLRKIHIEGKEDEVPACKKCNYWFWQPRLMNYQNN